MAPGNAPPGKVIVDGVEYDTFAMDCAEMNSLVNFFRKHAMFVQDLLNSMSLSSGIELQWSKNGNPVSENFSEFVKETWIPFGEDAIAMFKAIGVVVVLRGINEDGEMTPQTPITGSFQLRFYLKDGHVQWLVYDRSGDIMPNAFVPVFNKPIWDPDLKRYRFDTRLYKPWELSSTVNAIFRNAQTASKKAADPIIPLSWNIGNVGLSQMGKKNTAANRLDTANEIVYDQASGDVNATGGLMQEALDIAMDHIQNENLGHVRGPSKQQSDNVLDAAKGLLLLPPNFSVASTVQPAVLQNPIEYERLLRRDVISAMRVPESLFFNDSSVQANIVGQDNVLHTTVQNDKKILISIFTATYYFIYGDEDISAAIARLENEKAEMATKKGKKRTADNSETDSETEVQSESEKTDDSVGLDAERIRSETHISFNLPGIPTVGQDRLDHLKDRGVITDDAYLILTSRANGIPESMLSTGKLKPAAVQQPKRRRMNDIEANEKELKKDAKSRKSDVDELDDK